MNLREQKHKIAGKIRANHAAKPPTPMDRKLSKAHLRDSIKYNERHAKDHLRAAELDEKILKEK